MSGFTRYLYKKYPKCGEVYLNSIGIKVFDQLTQLKAQLLDQEAEDLKAGNIST